VLLWVTVTGKKDQLITELDRENFRIEEDGKEQQIIDFYLEDRPISMAILLDTSGSMQESMEEVHAAAGSFVETLRPEDQALVIDFDERVFLVQELTSDHEALREAITSTEPIGGTALFDAFHAAYRKLRDIEGRKAIVLLSDGDDTASQFGYRRVLEEAKANNIMIFAIGLEGGINSTLDRNVLKEFASVTGGRAFFVNKAEDLKDVYQRIAEELRTQHYMSYSTGISDWNGKWVKLKVNSDVPGHKVRARRGFFAVRAKE
jgi:Ca-activated chloride channel family protein